MTELNGAPENASPSRPRVMHRGGAKGEVAHGEDVHARSPMRPVAASRRPPRASTGDAVGEGRQERREAPGGRSGETPRWNPFHDGDPTRA